MTYPQVHEEQLPGPLETFHCFQQLRGRAPSVLLDGQPPAAALNRRAYVLFDPFEVVSFPVGSDLAAPAVDPIAALFARLERFSAPRRGGRARFRGGAAGFLSYDLGRFLEKLPRSALLSSAAPDLWFGLFNRGLEIDLESGAGTLFVAEVPGSARRGRGYAAAALADARARLAAPPAPLPAAQAAGPLRSNFARASYAAAVERVREYITRGDVYQVNLAQRFAAEFRGDPAAVYQRLRALNPAPFAAFVDTGAVHILSSSPERFLLLEGDAVETRPIKGTRPRTGRALEDERLKQDLMTSAKDAAELAMIVDLLRNDLGRVARFGSVEVAEAARLTTHATVFHREATVRARLRPDAGASDLIRAAFPGGSVTGAPKIRAMEVIEELEGVRRGPFTGSIGWIGFDGDLDLNIAIRTLVIEEGRAHFHAGGGVVLDSDPEAEYEETLAKARALAGALGSPLPD
ncbi:MAG: aminodeoxychorismate synthase component I [Planctomycetes bacterium]|nr:aminodeoxychorismate synthase component I [Planctomycetota bacterium]